MGEFDGTQRVQTTALITGVAGQDGALLAALVAADGHRVVGVVRPGTRNAAAAIAQGVNILEANLCDAATVDDLLAQHDPAAVYHLAAFHHSSQEPERSAALEAKEAMIRDNFLTTRTLALALARRRSAAHLVFASSSQIFSASSGMLRCDESTARNPGSFYGLCKSWSMDLLRFLRQESNMRFSSAILFNHESPHRAPRFVTRKISIAAARAKLGLPVNLELLNIGARVDWSDARDVVQALRLMAGAETPADYVVASGTLHSVRELLETAFGHVGLDWRRYAKYAEERDEPALVGDSTALRTRLGWKPVFDFRATIGSMVEHDLRLAVNPEPGPGETEVKHLIELFSDHRHAEAEALARRMIQSWPDHAVGWKALGTALAPQQRLAEALTVMRKTVELLPSDAEAHNNLGIVLTELGSLSEAEASCRRAIELAPGYFEAHNNLGNVLRALGRSEEAVRCHRRALEIRPDEPVAHNGLGNALRELGRLDEAANCYRRAAELKPDYHVAHHNLGNTLQALGHLDEAVRCFQTSLEIKPEAYELHDHLGNLLQRLGRMDEAVRCHRRALEIRPDCAPAHNHLGNALEPLGRLREAERCYRRALELNPDFHEAHCNLGNVLGSYGDFDEAIASYRRALSIKPDFAIAYNNLGNALQGLGRLTEAEASYRRALELAPDYYEAQGNLLFTLNYHPDRSAAEVFAAYREMDAHFGLPLRSHWRPHENERAPLKRLRVGYVSPDFRIHSCRHFIEPLLEHHAKSALEVFAYSDVPVEDEVTARMKSRVDAWVMTVGMSDAQMADRIRADRIDILVDLAGHTRGNRLRVFARKPAPVSVTHLQGFGATTGLSAIDWCLADPLVVPEGSEQLFSERPWRMSHCLVYRPPEGMGVVSPLPAIPSGRVVFGTLTRAVRINHRMIAAWSEILLRVPGARMIIDSTSFRKPGACQSVASQFAARGIGGERLGIGFHSPPWDLLRAIDITLDCFPHNCGTTLFESLCMGVPFVTLAGRPSVGRLGSSIAATAGHAEWIAASEAEYVEQAVALAADLPRLAELRARLRADMQGSPLMDEAGYARELEAAYREMWRRWCAGMPPAAYDAAALKQARRNEG